MQLLYILGVDWDIPLWLLLIISILVAYYKYMTWKFGFFKELGIPGPKPYPVFGNLMYMFKEPWQVRDKKMMGDNKVVGCFFGREPVMYVKDVSFNKQMLVKEFNNFEDRTKKDLGSKPMNRALTALRGEEWRVVRNTLTPTFSAGKMKRMNSQINACADQLRENIENSVNKDESFDFKELTGAYTMDVIARTGFGLEINSQKDKDSKFVSMAKEIMSGTLMSPFFIVLFFFPFALNILSYLKIVTSMARKPTNFFLEVVEQTLEARKDTKQKALDFIQLMVNAHKEETKDEDLDLESKEILQGDKHKKKTLTKDDILANALLFFLAGYETTANTLGFVGHCIATNPECQDKLIEDIDRVVGDKDPTYEILPELPYLEQIIQETLRLYPQAPTLSRFSKNDITIEGIYVPKNITVMIPVYSIHIDPDVYPDPMKFDPNRFSPEEKAKRDPYCWLPFGTGPRNCIGMRLALMEMKIAMIKILQQFKIVPCEETEIPIVVDPLRVKAKNGMKLKAVRRTKEQ